MRLHAENLSVARGEEIILVGLSLDVASGGMVVVEGPNGGGKSTLLRALAGLLPLESGGVTFTGSDEFAGVPLADAVHYLGHENAMKPQMSVADNLAFWRNLAAHPHCEPDEALEMVGLGGLGGLPFGHLSTGQRRRTAIARLLVAWRPVWLLDEPTAGLDARSQHQFADLLGVHLEDGGIIVATTHIELGLDDVTRLNVGDYAP